MNNSKTLNTLIKQVGMGTFAFFLLIAPTLANAALLSRQLEFGMTGTDVSDLQGFLAKDNTIYPQGLVTGYFGSLTKSAVSNFQSRNNIATVGRVGPITLNAINSQMSNTTMGDMNAPVISNVGINRTANNATISWATNQMAKGVVYYSNTPLVTYERTNSVDVSGTMAMTNTNLQTSQSVSIQGLQANTTYYYMIYSTDVNGNVTVTYPTSFQTSN